MLIKKAELLIGAHVSIKGGFGKAIKDSVAIGCKAIQFFTKSNRQWYAKKITQKDIIFFNQALKETKINRAHIIAHASYLINLASGNKVTAKQSYEGLLEELERCSLLGIPYLVLHPGSATGNLTTKEGIDQIVSFLESLLQQIPNTTMILLENMAGQGTVIGKNFEELASIINGLSTENQKKIGICIDTCHLFASGILFNTPSAYEAMWDHFDQLIGLTKIKVIHLNDSKSSCGSYIDRHEHIGQGTIPINSFKLLLKDEKLAFVPKILETPHASLNDHLINIQKVQFLYESE